MASPDTMPLKTLVSGSVYVLGFFTQLTVQVTQDERFVGVPDTRGRYLEVWLYFSPWVLGRRRVVKRRFL